MLRHLKHGTRRYICNLMLQLANANIYRKNEGTVLSGVFKGIYPKNQEVFGSITAKLLGTYEMELAPVLKILQLRNPRLIVNIGGAEGYYAIGIVCLWKANRAIVYEASQKGRELIAANARLNEIDHKIGIKGICTEQELFELVTLESVDLLVMDVEGEELELLSKRVIEKLKYSAVLIESHDFCIPGCIDKLKEKFSATHKLTLAHSRMRTHKDFPYKSFMSKNIKCMLMDEKRPEKMQWLIGLPMISQESLNT